MKNILIIALTLIAFAANAQTPATKEVSNTTISATVSQSTQTPAKANETPAPAPTAVGAPDNSAKFVGTNDLNISLLREGVKKA